MVYLRRRDRYAAAALLIAACGDDSSPGGGSETSSGPHTGASGSANGSASDSASTSSASLADSGTSSADAGSEGSGSSATVADSTGGIDTCPATHRCVADPPLGWAGPGVHRQPGADTRPEPCPATYPTADLSGGTELVAEAAACGCECGDAVGTSCELSATLRFYGESSACDGTPVTLALFTTVCNDLPLGFNPSTNWSLDPIEVTGGACSPIPTESVVPATFAVSGTTCGGGEILRQGCDPDQACVPDPEGEALCIWREGDNQCPESWEGRRWLYFAGIDDQRGCSECTCGSPMGLCDDAYAVLFEGYCIPPISAFVPADSQCHPSSGYSTQSVALNVGTPTAFCGPSPTQPVGDASGNLPWTVCCLE